MTNSLQAHDMGHSTRTGLVVGVVSTVAVLVVSVVMMLIMTEVSVLAALGLGIYCAFWLGGGFGTIFGSAAVFSDTH